MKLLSIFVLSASILFISCAQDSEQTDSSTSTSGTNANATAPATTQDQSAPASDFQQQNNTQSPQPVQPTLPSNLRQAAQQNAMTQQQQQFQMQQQQQQQQAAAQAQAAPIKTIGDEKTAHFICPNACKGSGADAAANCPTCGSPYTHNGDSPWHAANNQTPPTAAPTQNPAQPVNPATPAITTPVQNTNPLPTGDHNTSHYVCPDRCVGGGSAGPGKCPVCSKDYTHNAESPAHMEEVRRREQQQQP
ncbi:MAG: hypothetical protein KJO64_03110 [Bacteroidia bacterium]|nr:hypothetical protein [Bacteroidia bacterium]